MPARQRILTRWRLDPALAEVRDPKALGFGKVPPVAPPLPGAETTPPVGDAPPPAEGTPPF